VKVSTSLTSLDLGYNNIGDGGAVALAEAMKVITSLTRMDVRYNDIGIGGAVALAEAVKVSTSLTSLDLGDNNIRDGGARALLSNVAAKERRVGWTRTKGVFGVGERCFVEEILNGATWGAHIRSLLAENCLTELDLSRNNISSCDSICELYELKMLKKLDLSNNWND
jgi:Leucine-rich repeat (LRR) protein